MKLALSIYRPTSNWMTMLLLTLVISGFGLFAQYHVNTQGQALHVTQTQFVMARTHNR